MEKINTSLFGTPLLGGESADGKFGFKSEDGSPAVGNYAIFPIVRNHLDGTIDLLGTGFFISNSGLFVTARHVLEAPFDRKTGKQTYPISIIQFHSEGFIARPILRCAFHPIGDLAVGVTASVKRTSDGSTFKAKTIAIHLGDLAIGSSVMTYAYPRYESRMANGTQHVNLMPDFYEGKIVEHFPQGRDRVMLPGPCYRTSMMVHAGSSGGPVFSMDGRMFALNSTGYDGTEESYVSSLGGILDLVIDDLSLRGETPRSILVREIARAGFIKVTPPLSEKAYEVDLP